MPDGDQTPEEVAIEALDRARDLLGVPPGASVEEITAAHDRKLAEATERFASSELADVAKAGIDHARDVLLAAEADSTTRALPPAPQNRPSGSITASATNRPAASPEPAPVRRQIDVGRRFRRRKVTRLAIMSIIVIAIVAAGAIAGKHYLDQRDRDQAAREAAAAKAARLKETPKALVGHWRANKLADMTLRRNGTGAFGSSRLKCTATLRHLPSRKLPANFRLTANATCQVVSLTVRTTANKHRIRVVLHLRSGKSRTAVFNPLT